MDKVKMLGALVGDIIGSAYEFHPSKSMDFELLNGDSRFTDDSVMTLAVAKWLMEDAFHTTKHLVRCMQELGRRHPYAGYGGSFLGWLYEENPQPYNSWGNGALEGNSFEEIIRLAVSLGGDSDTIGAMAGAIAACIYPIQEEIAERCNSLLTDDLREIKDNFLNQRQQGLG